MEELDGLARTMLSVDVQPAKPSVRPLTDEVDRLRTAREELKLSFRPVVRR